MDSPRDSDLLIDAIRSRREVIGLSRRQLSLDCSLSPSYIAKLETGEIDPSIDAFAAISRRLNFSLEEIGIIVLSRGK